MSRDFTGLDLRPPAPRSTSDRSRRSLPPFRRRLPVSRRKGVRGPGPALSGRPLAGLSRGGTTDVLTGIPGRGRAAGVAISGGIHLLLLLVLFGGIVPVGAEEPAATPVAAEEPLLYAFEAPPLEESEALVALETPVPDPPPAEEPAAPPVEVVPEGPIVIPKAQIAVPGADFQNDLPFSQGDSEEFYVDEKPGEDPASESDSMESAEAAEPEPAAASESPADLAEPSAPEVEPPAPPRFLFDSDAFRRRIQDPAADVRRLGDELAMRKARVLAETERRKEGRPTDIWRFLEGKRFRNPEGGLVSNRNNTLYYDDRGANLVPWIGRLIAEVRRNWYIPYAASYEAGHVAIAISVLRSGELAWLQVVIPSGVPGFDNAAVGALRGAQLLPLPDDYPGADFEIMLVFWYNEQPYDLFSRR